MAGKKNKKGPGKAPSSGEALRQEVERLIKKEHYKDAVKQAKIAFKDAATEQNHRLLERAYLLRAKQLLRVGMPSSAVEVAGHLVEFGVTDPALVEDGARLLLALGMSGEADALLGRIESPEVRSALGLIVADQAVVHPERAKSAPAEIRQGAELVRAALEAVEAGDEARAMEGLREVSRSSPFADWKLFARGLAAFRRRELKEAGTNWDRLDPGRAASRIARALLGPGQAAPANGDAARPTRGPDFAALERVVFGEPILAPLARVRDLLAKGYWLEAVREVGPIRPALRRVDPALAQRLTRILLQPLIRHTESLEYQEAEALIGSFTRLAEPLPLDPNWNRFRALIWEGPQADDEGAAEYWGKYLDDLKASPNLSPDERVLAQALVWKHLAVLSLDTVEALEERDDPDAPTSSGVMAARFRAIACLEECIRLAPSHLRAHELLFNAHDDWDQPREAEAAALRLLELFPDHLDALAFLADHYLAEDQPEQGLKFAKRARLLKPLDPDIAVLEWDAHNALAHHLAFRGQFDEGRAAFAAAGPLTPDKTNARYRFFASRIAFELKASRADLAETLIREARALLSEPGPLWLAIEIEGHRYDLPRTDRDRFAELGKAARKARFRGATAGALAGVLMAYENEGVEYPDEDEREQEVLAYIRRGGTRVKYAVDELSTVCMFLFEFSKESDLLQKLAKSALKKFPEDPVFPFLLASLEIKKGPFRCDLDAVERHFQEALRLINASSNPTHATLLPQVKEGLALLEKLNSTLHGMPMGIPFAGFGSNGPTLDDLFMMFDDDDEDFDDDDEDDEGPAMDALPPPPKSHPAARKRRRR